MNLTTIDLDYYDLKKVRARLHKDEMAFALRASDITAPQMVDNYGQLLLTLPQEFTSEAIFRKGLHAKQFAQEMRNWQMRNPHLVKLPDMPGEYVTG